MPHVATITVAPNGARRSKANHPALPITTDEIAQTARACFEAGASAIHLHVRDDAGIHSLDAARYRDAIAAITAIAPNMAIQITTEAAGLYDVAAQYACLHDLAHPSASVSIREMARDPALAAQLYAFANEAAIDIQHILYTPADIAQLRTWFEDGTIAPDMTSAIFVLGQYNPPVLALPADLTPFLQATNDLNLNWTICAFGHHEHACARAAAQHGGNIRIGFENNIHLPDGTLARDNAQLVALAAAHISPPHSSKTVPLHEPHIPSPQ